jgi:hypothetical protein
VLYLFIVSCDLQRSAHVHPQQQFDGAFVLRGPIESGAYTLVAGVLPEDGTPQMLLQRLGSLRKGHSWISDRLFWRAEHASRS